MAKYNLPNDSTGNNNLTSEKNEYFRLYDLKPRGQTGNITFYSISSTVVYNTSTYNSGIYANQGQQGMLSILQDVLKDYNLTANDINELSNNIGDLDELSTANKTDLVGAVNELFQNANNGKQDWVDVVGSPLINTDTFATLKTKTQTIKNIIATNLTAKGISALATETLTSLANKITNIVRGSGNAIDSDVLLTKTYTNNSGVQSTGTMPNNGSVGTQILSSEGVEYTIPLGYHNGLGKVRATITGLLGSVIKAGTTVGGILGTFTSDATATANQMLSGVTAYVNGIKITGLIASLGALVFTPSGSSQTSGAGYTTGVTVNAVSVPVADVTAGTVIAGQIGTGANAKRYASGVTTADASDIVTVSGLTFTPSQLIVAYYSFDQLYGNEAYSARGKLFYNSRKIGALNYCKINGNGTATSVPISTSGGYINGSGFKLAGCGDVGGGHAYYWEAYE